jgi:hypothetical protein
MKLCFGTGQQSSELAVMANRPVRHDPSLPVREGVLSPVAKLESSIRERLRSQPGLPKPPTFSKSVITLKTAELSGDARTQPEYGQDASCELQASDELCIDPGKGMFKLAKNLVIFSRWCSLPQPVCANWKPQ